jgi:metal-responsive CopG/Arc/MetJ family transcriptional regulator
MRVSEDLVDAVDKWRMKQESQPSRSEAFRQLVELGLRAKRK